MLQLQQVATVNHQGTVIAFARDATGAIYYNVLALEASSQGEASDWTGYQQLAFPAQARPLGLGILTVDDPDLSPLGDAGEPFKVVSDQSYVCICRVSAAGTLLFDRFMLQASTDTRGVRGAPVLIPAWEVRFERSGKQDIPASKTDSQNYVDTGGDPFIEPTTELWLLRDIKAGAFELVVLPSESGTGRWQFFVVRNSEVDLYSFPMDDVGLFDLTGIQLDGNRMTPDQTFSLKLGTSPVQLQGVPSAALYTTQERVVAANGDSTLIGRSARVLLVVETVKLAGEPARFATIDFALAADGTLAPLAGQVTALPIEVADYALSFGPATSVKLDDPTHALTITGAFTIEAWIYPTSQLAIEQLIIGGETTASAPTTPPYLTVTPQLQIRVGFGDWTGTTAAPVVQLQKWLHVLATWDGLEFGLVINDAAVTVTRGIGKVAPAGGAVTQIGSPEGGFIGVIDNVTLSRGIGNTATQIGNWPFDSVDYTGKDATTPNIAVGGGPQGIVLGAMQVASTAPILGGDSQGFETIDPATGLSVYTGVLQFATPASSPFVLAGADGLLHLYYQDQTGKLEVVQFDAEAARAAYQASWATEIGSDADQTGPLWFVAARAGTYMNEATANVAPTDGHDDLCDVTLSLDVAPHTIEHWFGVPRDLDAFQAVLAGTSTDNPNDPAIATNGVTFYDNTGTYYMSRLAATSPHGPLAVLALSRAQPQLTLASVGVTAQTAATAAVAIALTVPSWNGATVTATWPGAPTNASALVQVLRGTSPVYSYPAAPNTVTLAPVPPNGATVGFVALLTAYSLAITGADAASCTIAVWQNATDTTPIEVTGVARDQLSIAKAINQSPLLAGIAVAVASGVAAYVANQAAAPATTRAWSQLVNVFSEQPLAGDEVVVAAPYPAAILQHAYSESAPITPLTVSTLFGAVAGTTPTNGAPGTVQYTDGAPLAIQATAGGWINETPSRAVAVAAGQHVTWPPPASSNALALAEDQTAQIWVDVTTTMVNRARLLTYNEPQATDPAPLQYALGLIGGGALSLGAAIEDVQVEGSVTVPAALRTLDFTAQLWLQPNAGEGIVLTQATAGLIQPQIQILLGADSRVVVHTGSLSVATPTAIPRTAWSQLTVTVAYGVTTGASVLTLYVDGKVSATARGPVLVPIVTSGFVLGRQIANSFGVAGLALWSRVLAAAEIMTTFGQPPSPADPDLVGLWYLMPHSRNVVANAAIGAGAGAAVISGNAAWLPDAGIYTVAYAANRDHAVIANTAPLATGWNYVTSVYQIGQGVHFVKNASCDCGNDQSQNIANAATLEAWIQPDVPGTAQMLISKGDAYSLSLTADGHVQLMIGTTASFGALQITSPAAITFGVPHYLAAVVQTSQITLVDTQLYSLTAAVYVDGKVVALLPLQTTEQFSLSASSDDLTFARASAGGSPYSGVLADVRLWSIALSTADIFERYQLHVPPAAAQSGLVSWWRFVPNGSVAYDEHDLSNGKLTSSELWVDFPASSTLSLAVNGAPVTMTSASIADVGGYGASQITVGALVPTGTPAPAPALPLAGTIDELRLWNVALAPDQIAENMFRPLTGVETGLAGYWPFDAGSGIAVNDATANGNNGTLAAGQTGGLPEWLPSTAPINDEAPEVLNANNGVATAYNIAITGTPAVVEYAATELDANGNPYSVMKRAYLAPQAGDVDLITGFKVGDLDTLYGGQVQTDATLVGYIEGGPPIPSENQTMPFWSDVLQINGYTGASSVQVTQADQTTIGFSSQQAIGDATALGGSAGLAFDEEVSAGTSIAGIGEIDFLILAATGRVGYVGNRGVTATTNDSLGFGFAKTTTTTDTLTPGGTWVPPATDGSVVPRWVPDNIGYAVVTSLTADVYFARLQGTNTVVATTYVPDLDIPRDVNVIPFPIASGYTKNGTLDGMVGLAADPDFPGAGPTSYSSYFKPLDAYQVVRDIQKADKQLAAYYDQYDVTKASHGLTLSDSDRESADDSPSTGFTDFRDTTLSQDPAFDWSTNTSRRNLANTYVWTAVGGLHAEEESALDTYTESYAGVASWTATDGIEVDLSIVQPVGVYGSFDALWSGSLDVTATRTKSSQHGFGLASVAKPDGFLKAPTFTGGAPSGYTAGDAPGKVNAYRFMSFFLSPSAANYGDFYGRVVDLDWLNTSSDPNAAALRGAADATNGAWRVFHRVTYVSRVPPPTVPTPTQATPPPIVPPANVPHNQLLVGMIQAELPANPTPQDIGTAVATVIGNPLTKTPGTIAPFLPWWTPFFATATSDARSDEAAEYAAFQADVLQYILQLYASASAGGQPAKQFVSRGAPAKRQRRARARRRH